MQIPTEMVVASLTILATALGGLIVMVVNSNSKNSEKVQEAIGGLTDAINSIHTWMSSKDTADEYRASDCNKNHRNISHGTQLTDHNT